MKLRTLHLVLILLLFESTATARDPQEIRAALAAARANGGGTVTLQPETYDLGTSRLDLTGIDNLSLDGNGATLLIDGPLSTANEPAAQAGSVIHCENPRRLAIRNLTIRCKTPAIKTSKTGRWGIDLYAVGDGGTSGDVTITNCRGFGLKSLLICEGLTSHKIQGIRIRDCVAEECFYGVSFSDHGDDVVIDNLICRNVVRPYIGIGVHNHRLQMTIDRDGVFPTVETAVLFKCYTQDSAGFVADVTVTGSVDGLQRVVGLEHQRLATARPTTLRDVRIRVTFLAPRKACQALGFAAWRESPIPGGAPKLLTTTNDRWERITVEGFVAAGENPIGYSGLDAASRPFVDNRLLVR